MKTCLTLSLILVATLARAADDPEASCRSRLRNLGGAISAYRLIHENKPPAKLSDLYLDGLVTSLEDFVCPASGNSVKTDSEIDAKSDYTLESAAGAKDMFVREKTARHGGAPLAIFADGSIKPVGATGATASSPSPPAVAQAPASPSAASPSPSPSAVARATASPSPSPSPPVVAQTTASPASSPPPKSGTPPPSAEAETAYELGLQYFRGGGAVLIDHKKSFENFQRAAEQNLPEAQARLAELWSQRGWHDFVHAADAAKAAELAKQALAGGLEARAEAGKHQSEYELGSLYLYGLGVQKDEAKAAKLFRAAADHGNKDAKRVLGHLYWTGAGVTADFQAAETYLKAAAAENVATARVLLGLLYSTGPPGVPKSEANAFALFQQAADQGLPSAMDKLAECFEKGSGVQQNLTKAVEWYQKAAERGLWSSQLKLGEMYEQGRGVTKDLTKAAEYYQKVADQGIKQGKDALARITSENSQKRTDASAPPASSLPPASNQAIADLAADFHPATSPGTTATNIRGTISGMWNYFQDSDLSTTNGNDGALSWKRHDKYENSKQGYAGTDTDFGLVFPLISRERLLDGPTPPPPAGSIMGHPSGRKYLAIQYRLGTMESVQKLAIQYRFEKPNLFHQNEVHIIKNSGGVEKLLFSKKDLGAGQSNQVAMGTLAQVGTLGPGDSIWIMLGAAGDAAGDQTWLQLTLRGNAE